MIFNSCPSVIICWTKKYFATDLRSTALNSWNPQKKKNQGMFHGLFPQKHAKKHQGPLLGTLKKGILRKTPEQTNFRGACITKKRSKRDMMGGLRSQFLCKGSVALGCDAQETHKSKNHQKLCCVFVSYYVSASCYTKRSLHSLNHSAIQQAPDFPIPTSFLEKTLSCKR